MDRIGVKIYLVVFLLYIPMFTEAQKKDSLREWTLDSCIKYALERNIELNLQKLDVKLKSIYVSDKKWAFAPQVSVSSVYNLSTGRVLDATTYNFITNKTVRSLTSSAFANMTLFNGFKNIQQLRAVEIDLKLSNLQVEQASNDLQLNITAFFLKTLCLKENIRNCELLAESLRQQEQHTKKQVEMGKVTMSDLLQVSARLAEAENTILSALHAYDISRLNLCQLLEIDDFKSFVPCLDKKDSICYILKNYDSVIENADKLPQIDIAENVVKLSKERIKIAKASYYPTLSLGIGYGSIYSSARQKLIQNSNKSSQYDSYSISAQLHDNANGYISLNLTVPILNSMSARNGVKKAIIELEKSKYTMKTVRKQLRKEVIQAIIDAEIAWKRYIGSVQYLESAKEALRQISIKYNAGAARMTEYTTAVSAMVDAQYQQLTSKYEYVFKLKVIEFYELGAMKD